MKYWGTIDGIKIYENNPEKKKEAFKRGLTILANLRLKEVEKL